MVAKVSVPSRLSNTLFFPSQPFLQFECVWVYTVNPYYLQILCLWVCLLPKFICNHQISTHSTFEVICGHVQSREEFESFNAHAPNWGLRKWHSASYFGSQALYMSFSRSIFLHVFHIFWPLVGGFAIWNGPEALKHSAEVVSCSQSQESEEVLCGEKQRHKLYCCWLWVQH